MVSWNGFWAAVEMCFHFGEETVDFDGGLYLRGFGDLYEQTGRGGQSCESFSPVRDIV